MATDTRVQETEKTGKSTAVRRAGRLHILYSYFTEVAAHDVREDVVYVSDLFWSQATKRHIEKFIADTSPKKVVELNQFEFECRVHTYLADRAKRRAQKAAKAEDEFDTTFDPTDEAIGKAVDRASTAKKRVKKIKVPIDIPVMFVIDASDDDEDEDDD